MGSVSEYIELTPQQKKYYEERKTIRHRLDMRSQTLHNLRPGVIVEIEEGLQKWWEAWQDQPDEIIVDSVLDFEEICTGKRRQIPAWASPIAFYETRWSISANYQVIPVFETT